MAIELVALDVTRPYASMVSIGTALAEPYVPAVTPLFSKPTLSVAPDLVEVTPLIPANITFTPEVTEYPISTVEVANVQFV